MKFIHFLLFTPVLLFTFNCLAEMLTGGIFEQNTKMDSRVLLSFNRTGPKLCVRLCMKYSDCNAINFDKYTLICELLTVSYPGDQYINTAGHLFAEVNNWKLIGDPCWPNPCSGQKKCVVVKHQYPICVNYAKFCDKYPCKNGGICKNQNGEYDCVCSNGNSGDRCQSSKCDSNPCKNGGRCISLHGGYSCSCVNGYHGNNCQSRSCDSNPCRNNGECHLLDDGFNCTCVSGYFGDRCESSLCHANPCKNGQACTIKDGYFFCQ